MEPVIKLTEEDTIDTLFAQSEEVDNVQDYYTYRIIMGLRCFGHDRIDAMLDRCKGFDINHKVYGFNIGMPFCEHLNDISVIKKKDNYMVTDIADNRFMGSISTDEFGMVRFFGGVIQYAILKNDLDLVQHLHDLGAKIEYVTPTGYDVTREYINSSEMIQLVSKLRQEDEAKKAIKPNRNKRRSRIRHR
jgi:hypothetical protein